MEQPVHSPCEIFCPGVRYITKELRDSTNFVSPIVIANRKNAVSLDDQLSSFDEQIHEHTNTNTSTQSDEGPSSSCTTRLILVSSIPLNETSIFSSRHTFISFATALEMKTTWMSD